MGIIVYLAQYIDAAHVKEPFTREPSPDVALHCHRLHLAVKGWGTMS